MNLLLPVPVGSVVTYTYAQHVAWARAHPDIRYNGGIDWGVATGTPIRAAADGKVSYVGEDNSGYGRHVRIVHEDGYMTLYGHLLDYGVVVGDIVKAGAVIGRSDNTGNSTGPHLHFELRKNGTAIDPTGMIVTAPPVPQPPVVVTHYKVLGDGLRVRVGPGIGYTTVRQLMTGDIVDSVDKDEWVKLTTGEYVAKRFNGVDYLEEVGDDSKG